MVNLIKKEHVQIVAFAQIYNHLHECEQFEHVLSLLNSPTNLLDVKYRISIFDLIFYKCYIIDCSNDWSLLLLKEAYYIRRSDRKISWILLPSSQSNSSGLSLKDKKITASEEL